MERLVTHLWDGSWATMGRRDLWLHEVDGGWRVRMRRGQRPSVERVFPTEADAVEMLESIARDAGADWRDITDAHRPTNRTD